jgi:hypothetical protein
MNPYDFVRLVGDGPQRTRAPYHERFQGQSGRIGCTLTTRTPLFVSASQPQHSQSHQTLRMQQDPGGTPIIPGASLKGVVRSVAEAAANACLPLPRYFSYDRQRVRYQVPSGFLACRSPDALCPACRLFGMLNQGEVLAGHVSIGEARAEGPVQMQRLTLAVLDAPKPRHTPFYADPRAPDRDPPLIRGRKFYFHRPDGVQVRSEQGRHNKTVFAVPAATAFSFEVDYVNVLPEDLDLLLFALVLWPDSCHKVGMGKPLGLGSAKLALRTVRTLDPRQRYLRLGDGWSDELTGDALEAWVAGRIAGYREGRGDNLQDLRRILSWDSAPEHLAYPSEAWFAENPTTPLEVFQKESP